MQSLWTTQISYLCCSISFHNDQVAVIMLFFQKQRHCHPCGRPRKLGLEWQTGHQSIARWGWGHLLGREAETSDILHTSLIAPPMYRLLRVSFRRSKPCFVWSPPSPKHTTQICASQPNLYRWTKYAFHSQDHLFIPQDVRLVASKVIDWYQENNPIDRRNEICLKKIYGGNQEANLIQFNLII